MKPRTEAEIQADIALKRSQRQSVAALLKELQRAVVRRLRAEVRANAKNAKRSKAA